MGCKKLVGVRGVSSSSSFDPGDITGLAAWFDASNAASVLDAAGGSVVSADDGLVGSWGDLSGNSRDIVQASAGVKPKLKLAVQNGRNILRFEGAQWLGRAAFGLETTFTLVCVSKRTSSNGAMMSMGNSGTTNSYVQFSISTTPTLIGNVVDDAGTQVDAGGFALATDSNWHVNVFRRDTDNFHLRQDATTGDTTETLGALTTNLFTVGSRRRSTIGLFFNGDVAEVCAYSTAVSNADLDTLIAHLAAKWGI